MSNSKQGTGRPEMGDASEVAGQQPSPGRPPELDHVARLSLLPQMTYVDRPEHIERFTVRLYPDGRLVFQGSPREVEHFLEVCKEEGLALDVEGISYCG